ncbi:MAG: DUF1343 domain-containing protein [Chlamydiae bacterium]|nr:DUF1343 domain-containing protein [Chlamydiota bacterium]
MKHFLLLLAISRLLASPVTVGLDVFFDDGHDALLKGKRVGLITNHTAINRDYKLAVDLMKTKGSSFELKALFSPEHGLTGLAYAFENVKSQEGKIPIYSLHGDTRRPTKQMLDEVDVLIFDIQDNGCRGYTYASTLFYAMEEAAKHKKELIVLDRPNPLGGLLVDGPMLEDDSRSFIGYVNVAYCHGMTIGELAKFFNSEYSIGCNLKVVAMKGWKREMIFKDTGLVWIPLSPYMPESDTPFFSASTGILGELGLVSIGIGYTLPFKIVGAPWISAEEFAKQLNAQKLPGVWFSPFHYRPFYGLYKEKDCQGVKIQILNHKEYRPLMVQYLIIGLLKSLYPEKVSELLNNLPKTKKNLFCLANGNKEMLSILEKEKYPSWKLIEYKKEEKEKFLLKRKKYLLSQYN